MSGKFQIQFKKNNGDLHVRPRGKFDGSSAWQLVNLIDKKYDGRGRIIIDTHNLHDMCPFGCSAFRFRLIHSSLPLNRVSFQGEKGYEIAPRGSRVFTSPKKNNCECSGNCAQCPCAEKIKQN